MWHVQGVDHRVWNVYLDIHTQASLSKVEILPTKTYVFDGSWQLCSSPATTQLGNSTSTASWEIVTARNIPSEDVFQNGEEPHFRRGIVNRIDHIATWDCVCTPEQKNGVNCDHSYLKGRTFLLFRVSLFQLSTMRVVSCSSIVC